MATTVGIYAARTKGLEELGLVTVRDGTVIVEPADVERLLDEIYVPDLSNPSRRRLELADGQAFVDALPRALAGSHLRAVEIA